MCKVLIAKVVDLVVRRALGGLWDLVHLGMRESPPEQKCQAPAVGIVGLKGTPASRQDKHETHLRRWQK